MSNLDKNVADFLDVEAPPLPVLMEPPEMDELVVPDASPVVGSTDLEIDVTRARANIRDLIETGQNALEELGELARSDESARTYEVFGQLLKHLVDANKDSIDIHKKAREARGVKTVHDSGPQQINVDKAVFVGSSNDMIQRLKDRREAAAAGK